MFIAGLKHFQAAGKSLVDVAKALLAALKENGLTAEAAQGMRPYLVRFIDDVDKGVIKLGKEAPDEEAPIEDEAAHEFITHSSPEGTRGDRGKSTSAPHAKAFLGSRSRR